MRKPREVTSVFFVRSGRSHDLREVGGEPLERWDLEKSSSRQRALGALSKAQVNLDFKDFFYFFKN